MCQVDIIKSGPVFGISVPGVAALPPGRRTSRRGVRLSRPVPIVPLNKHCESLGSFDKTWSSTGIAIEPMNIRAPQLREGSDLPYCMFPLRVRGWGGSDSGRLCVSEGVTGTEEWTPLRQLRWLLRCAQYSAPGTSEVFREAPEGEWSMST